MKTSKLLALALSTAISIVSVATTATANISTNEVTPNGNNNLAGIFGEVKDGSDLIGQPIREIADPYLNNIWYASLYPEVKEDIDRNYSGGNRINQYIRICYTIAINKGIKGSPPIWIPVFADIAEYIGSRAALAVKEEDGTINCYTRDFQNPN